jgi:hypothetical protein
MADAQRAPSSRREMLAAAAGGAAALAASALVRPLPAAAASTALMTEVDNPTEAKTSVSALASLTTASDIAFEVSVGDLATAIHGESPSGAGIHGSNTDSMAGVIGHSMNAVGVAGSSGAPFEASSVTGITAGVLGQCGVEGSAGVLGLGGDVGVEAGAIIGVFAVGETGVVGIGDGLGPPGQFGTGVYGYTGGLPPAPPVNVGVYARGDGAATALRVQGKAVFSRSGRTSVAAGKASRVVTMAGVTSSSLVLVTLRTFRTGVYVAAAVPATGKFTVYLNKAVTAATYFSYLVLD